MDLNDEKPYFGPPKFHEKMQAVYKKEKKLHQEITRERRKIAKKKEDDLCSCGTSERTRSLDEDLEDHNESFESFIMDTKD